ncbi:MAG: hypothetical protein WA989_11765 [Henriciella sp.]|uniref:TraR/DksA family transcriptional regulator n=1 Tax=Henriciella sp. TaxID=1968823 RepID=UPI003C740EC4
MNRQTGLGPKGIDFSSKTSSDTSSGDGAGRRASPATRQLKRIDAALRRLESGRFGHCLYCGDQIALRRLNHDPSIESCAVCDEN